MPAPPSRDAMSLPALADRCVQCGLCLPHCPTYRLDASEAESPRGRIAYAKAVSTGQLAPTPVGDRHLDHCLGCLRCEQVCPAGVEYGSLLNLARAEHASRRPRPIVQRLRLGLLARPFWLTRLLGLYRLAYGWLPTTWRSLPRPPEPLARSPLLPPTHPEAGSGLAVFSGCVASVYETNVRAALELCLGSLGMRSVPTSAQGCCGTASLHAGDTAMAERLADSNRRAFARVETVICLATGCRDVLGRNLAGTSTVLDALAFLHRCGETLRFRSAGGRRVALHLPCSQRSDPDSLIATRALLARIPDLDVQELPDTGCCGAAGLHMLEERERAERLRAPLIEAMQRNDGRELLSANIGCRLHLANGTTMPVRHPIEFLAEHLA
ncbi:(Fe-S)-binding protein [Arenimonas sp.]|uniref:(Fe-S)-binding protein n=1 Tax=Arenimonas sp. TaxID=1872635 RepID=UPI0039E47CF7